MHRKQLISQTSRHITSAGLATSSAEILPANSVLLSSRAPIGLTAINTIPMATNQGFKSLVPHPASVDTAYLYWWLTSRSRQLQHLGVGATFKEISKSALARVEVPLPMLDEQRRIAEILDKVDGLRAKRREAIAHLDNLAQSIFHEMFGDPVQQLSSVAAVRLDSLGTVKTGNTPPRIDPANFGSHVEWIKTDNIKPDSAIVGPSAEGLSESGAMKGRIVQPGSVLMTCIAGSPRVIGNVALADRVLAFNQQINAFTPYRGESFFWLHLLKAMKSAVQRLSTGGMTGLVSKSALSSLVVPDWPEASQGDFAKRIAALERVKAAQRAQLAEFDTLFASLQERAFKGEL